MKMTQDELKAIADRLEEEHKRLRRRIEDALRKTASLEELKEIARPKGNARALIRKDRCLFLFVLIRSKLLHFSR